jgi:hypothetical protein
MTSPPALEWLHAEFEQNLRRHKQQSRSRSPGQHWHGPSFIRPIIQLRTVMDGGVPMHVCQADYDDPVRWWL